MWKSNEQVQVKHREKLLLNLVCKDWYQYLHSVYGLRANDGFKW